GVPDTNGLGAFVAVEPVKLHFGEPALASNAIHDLHLSWIAGDRAQHPLEECLCFIFQAGKDERAQRERAVSQPAEAIVPVAHAAGSFWQRRCGRSDNAPSRRIDASFDCDQGTEYKVAIKFWKMQF